MHFCEYTHYLFILKFLFYLQESQKKRGGGTVCINNKKLATLYQKSIDGYQKCEWFVTTITTFSNKLFIYNINYKTTVVLLLRRSFVWRLWTTVLQNLYFSLKITGLIIAVVLWVLVFRCFRSPRAYRFVGYSNNLSAQAWYIRRGCRRGRGRRWWWFVENYDAGLKTTANRRKRTGALRDSQNCRCSCHFSVWG